MTQKVFAEFEIEKPKLVKWARATAKKHSITTKEVLATVMGNYEAQSVEELSHNDLVMELLDIYKSGVKGFDNMTVAELVEEVWECIVNPESSSVYECGEPTWTDAEILLDRFGP